MSYSGNGYPVAGADIVMTTSGDMVKYESGARARLGIGSANQVLQVKSSLPSWETLSTADSVLTTQGDVLYESASGLARLGFGTTGDVLTTKGTGANPVWETPASSGANTALSNLSSPSVNESIDMNTNNITNIQYFGCKAYVEKTIASNNITFTQTLTEIDTEADASADDLDGFAGLVNGYWLSLKSVDNARDPTLRSGIAGENKMNGVGSYTLSDKDYRWIGNCYIASYFSIQELSRSSNSS